MGYNTSFDGCLKFTHVITAPEIAELKSLEMADSREMDPSPDGDWYFFDLELNKEMDGLQWNGAEKTYDMVGQVNWIIDHMRKKWPEFGLSGELSAAGDDREDVWVLRIVDGKAQRNEFLKNKTKCPKCGHDF